MNNKKNQTLGMPHGTACGRLRKNILFHLLHKYSEDVCVRCGKKIETVDDLSIEHIKPWEGISAELFWDLSNIAFSHIRCNTPHTHPGNIGGEGGISQRKIAPENMAWCTGCKKFEPIENFHRNGARWNGLQGYCKKTHAEILSI